MISNLPPPDERRKPFSPNLALWIADVSPFATGFCNMARPTKHLQIVDMVPSATVKRSDVVNLQTPRSTAFSAPVAVAFQRQASERLPIA